MIPPDTGWMTDEERSHVAGRYPYFGRTVGSVGTLIYFIQVGDDGPIKIGISVDVAARLAGLQTANPYELCIRATVEGDMLTEGALHHRFRRDRIRLEWFRPSESLLGLIANLQRDRWPLCPSCAGPVRVGHLLSQPLLSICEGCEMRLQWAGKGWRHVGWGIA